MEIRLGEKIRTLRKQAGLTQEALAEALGVTPGAVYKWESGRAMPELELLVEIGEFFETSVDALLDYGWEKRNMGQAAEKLRQFARDKNLREGMRYAERVLQKYPNSFSVVYLSAEIYFLSLSPEFAGRAEALYRRAVTLFDQNTDERITLPGIYDRIAYCYCYMDRTADAVALLKKNNAGGKNDYRIGLLLSQDAEKANEALLYLSDALVACYGQLYNICIGYANAYGALEEPDKITELVSWMLALGEGLRDVGTVNWMDRGNVRLYTILAEMDLLRGNEQRAEDWLRKAGEAARRFDAAPEYRTGVGLKFFHGSHEMTSYDDMGETAMAMIEKTLAEAENGEALRPLWERVRAEELKEELRDSKGPSTDGCLSQGNATGRMKGEKPAQEELYNEKE
ncbi:MAG: helix-turn-helix transcriptional regulator [Faecousia sp.]